MNIIELAKQAGFNPVSYMGSNTELFEHFADLVRAAALEEAAVWFLTEDNKHMFHSEMLWPHQVAERLRALKEKS